MSAAQSPGYRDRPGLPLIACFVGSLHRSTSQAVVKQETTILYEVTRILDKATHTDGSLAN